MTPASGLAAVYGFAAAAFAAAAGCQEAPRPQPPTRFERVLWCADPARGAPLAKQNGYTAVQLGRGGDPAAVRAAGLGFYLDQPIGKGVLELRDEPWRALQDAYLQSRDVAALVRPTCLQAPGVVATAAADAAREAARVRGPGLLFVALADEASATRHDAPLDTCRCAHCLAAFRTFVQQRLGSIEAANAALGTQFASFEQLQPVSTDQLRRRELGDALLPADLRAFALWLDFVDAQYANAVTTMAAAVQAELRDVPVGLTGLQPPAAFGGNDYARYVPSLSLLEPYALGGACELVRSFAPVGAHTYATLAPPDARALGPLPLASFVSAQVAAYAAAGLAGVVVWNDTSIAAAGGEATPFGAAVRAAFARWGSVLDACAGARVVPSPVWLVESQASVRTWWMLDSAADGMTWPRRLASYEAEHSTSQAARRSWIELLQDLGLQPWFVAEATLPERLLRERPRCLVLPATVALADRTVQAINAYVRSGGVVIADHSVGIYDELLRRREAGALDALFGVTARSLRFDDLWVREGRSTSRESGLPLAEANLRGQTAEQRREGDAHIEQGGRGRAVYLNAPVVAYSAWRLAPEHVVPARELRRRVRSILHVAGIDPICEVRGDGLPTCIERVHLRLRDGRDVLAIRVNALTAPKVLHTIAAPGARACKLELPAARTLRPLGGDDLGSATSFDVRLDPLGALFFEVVR